MTQGTKVVPESDWYYASPAAVADTNLDEVAPAVTGRRNYVSAIQVCNTDTSVGTVVQIVSGASTVIWTGFVNPFVAAAPGQNQIAIEFPRPIPGTVSEALSVKNVTTSAETYFCLQGFVAL